MKSRYLSAAALVAAFAVAAIAPAGAAGHVRRVPVARALTIHAQPNPIVTGDPVVIFGRLFGRNHADRLLVLYFHGAGSPIGFMPVQTTRTDSTGAYEFSRADGFVDTNRSWYVASAGAVSRVVNERVASLVTITATGPGGVAEPSGSVLQTGRGYTYTFSGTVDPAGQTVALLQRQSASAGADHWATIGSGPVSAAGTYSIAHTFVVPSSSGGDADVRVFIRRDVRNIGSASESLSYEIEQTQNPKLTITPTSYSIPEGSPDTINGVDAAGSGQLLTLYGHIAGHAFQAVATTRSGAGGAYSFPVSPVNNTYYQVRSGAISSVVSGSSGASGVSGSSGSSGASGASDAADIDSAVAFVGVRDVLTLTTTPTTINQGQTVTFSGTVTPNETGHSIYLERENAAGTAWYVLAAGKVGPNSTYSLGWAFYEIGTQQVRVAITGGPLNEGAVTAPIAVTVDAIPAAALVPASG
jgi:hypothetical protein